MVLFHALTNERPADESRRAVTNNQVMDQPGSGYDHDRRPPNADTLSLGKWRHRAVYRTRAVVRLPWRDALAWALDKFVILHAADVA